MTYSAGYKQTYPLPGGALMEFVWIPAGEFQMGSPHPKDGHEWPRHRDVMWRFVAVFG